MKNIGNKNFIAIAPGTVWETKKYPIEHLVEVIKFFVDKNRFNILLIGGKDDVYLSEKY